MRKYLCLLILVFCIGSTPKQVPADIIQDIGGHGYSLDFYEPMGQSFEAVDSVLGSIAFGFYDFNQFQSNLPVTMNLYEGAGLGGTLLGSKSQLLPTTFSGIAYSYFDFNGVVLAVGNMYTATITAENNRHHGIFSDVSVYAGGGRI